MWLDCPKCKQKVWRAKGGTLFNDYPTENEHKHQLFKDFMKR